MYFLFHFSSLILINIQSWNLLDLIANRNTRLDRPIPETARFQERFTTPLPRPGFVRVAKKLDLVTVSSASVIISRSAFRYSFPYLFRFGHVDANLFATRVRHIWRDGFSPMNHEERERDRDLKKNCFRIYRISLAALCRRFLIFYSATRNTISVRDFSNRSLSSRGIRLARDERVIVAN